MSELVPRGKDGLSRRDARDLSRSVARMSGHGLMEKARINQIAELQIDRIAAISRVGQAAIYNDALVDDVADVVSRMVPSSSDRVQAMADATAILMLKTLGKTGEMLEG